MVLVVVVVVLVSVLFESKAGFRLGCAISGLKGFSQAGRRCWTIAELQYVFS